MNINLKRPLAFIDLETTGKDIVKDRIVQIAILKVFPDGSDDIKALTINPTVSIPPAASKVHGIYDNDVINSPTFDQVAQSLAAFIGNSDIAGYNSNKFDIPLLLAELFRAEVDFKLEGRNIVDVLTIFHEMEPRNLKAAYKFYCDKNLVGAHDAANDVRATYEVLKAQLQHYENVPYENKEGNISYPIQNNLEILSSFTPINLLDPTKKVVYDDEQREIFNFGKHKGKTLLQVFSKDDPSYYDWMMKGDFSVFTKKAIKKVWESIHQ
ncbi:DNA polymerase III subunit epsilon [Nostoc linckia z18]|uniref:DNA polymerase III subunit epsilon n=2 Tax=Nostoc linckia TaxID=92942 RepID=A0A9Q6EL25_NOSLI|nr:3'-5' exonuclease [Nostoc linckia]PHK42258.1 DNA polymerase III subunit epsilon [Nostoc linckia z15]PHK45465.1 DNA polymerase III subunit epsilon [Nostoc linckia z16]PHJ59043.1 DNA polymerase III subunit epsilon [Nostoc linckia z1]PHJ61896.1 DNA polymerase III subunit epsilon [Nostoc linckia z3]PHJ67813.1 DNA polymerase III subunit epsilon [Nostoc linckia z2]